jgi:uncharacterized protein (DUF2236 family)
MLVAAVRAAVVQMFQPATAAGVYQNSVYQKDPFGRLRRTGAYFMTVIYGDGEAAVEAADNLRRVHSRVTGIEPLSGEPYAANDPENQLWVHVTTWHSALYCYEKYGGGKLTPAREARYWRESQTASELQALDPDSVPGSREQVREYFAAMRPSLCVSEGARETIDWLLAPRAPSLTLRPLEPALAFVGRAAAATIPSYMRDLGGFGRSRLPDAGVVPLTRAGAALLGVRPLDRVFAAISPEAYAVRQAAQFGPPPRREQTVTLAEARKGAGPQAACAAGR